MDNRSRACRIAVIAGLAALLGACSQEQPETAGQRTEMPAEELMESMLADKAPLIIDVRSTDEFTEGHLPGAVNIAHTEFVDNPEAAMSQLPEARDTEMVLHCVSGKRASMAAEALVAAGYTNVLILEGNFRDWEARGYPVLTSK